MKFHQLPVIQGDGCPHTAVKRILNDNKFYVRFIATFLSLFIAIEIVNALTGTTPFLSLRLNSLLSILFDIFNHAVTFINYLLLGTILWILFGTVSAVGKIKSARSAESGLSGSFIIYCRIGLEVFLRLRGIYFAPSTFSWQALHC
jgi:hypothetical protein